MLPPILYMYFGKGHRRRLATESNTELQWNHQDNYPELFDWLYINLIGGGMDMSMHGQELENRQTSCNAMGHYVK